MFSRYGVFLSCLYFACSTVCADEPSPTASYAQRLVAFHYQRGWDAEKGVVRSDLDGQGELVSSRVYNVALSRLIYGLAYASRYDTAYLEKAKKLAQFQLESLINIENGEPSFRSYWSPEVIDQSQTIDVWQQAYGLCGLVELYRQSPDAALLAHIHQLHNSFVSRFYDTKHGGFWGSVDLSKGADQGSKSLQSAMYPLTAYMLNLWLADGTNRELYEPYILSSLNIVSSQAWQPNWVNIRFSDSWQACEPNTADCPNVTPGHNFQVAALLLRAAKLPFVEAASKANYQKQGMQLLENTLKSKTVFPAGIAKGLVSEVNPSKGIVMDSRRTWWQHAEALVALSLVPEQFTEERSALTEMYFSTFWDVVNGGEYFYLDEDLVPDQTENKGSIGKSAYHSIEAIRFLNEGGIELSF